MKRDPCQIVISSIFFPSAALNSLRLLCYTSDSQGTLQESFLGLEDGGQRRSMDEDSGERKVSVANSSGRGENESAYGKHDGVQEAAEKRKAEWRFQHVGVGY